MNNALWTAFYSRLSGGSTLANAVATLQGGTTPAICHNAAPEGQAYPYLVYSWAGGGFTSNSPHVDGNGVVRVLVYSSVDDAQAGSINALAFGLLDRQALTVSGWANFGLAAEAPHLDFTDVDKSGKQIWVAGDDYRVWLDKT